MSQIRPSAGYTLALHVELDDTPGTLGRLTMAIGEAGGDIEALDIVGHRKGAVRREVTVKCRDDVHGTEVVAAARAVPGVQILAVTDRIFAIHQGGKITVEPKLPLRTRDDLSMAYTPGVGRVCEAIAAAPERVWELTIKRNSVAVLSNGTAVLGLGDIGAEAALPVMEGKAMLFKEFAGIDAYPLCIRAHGVEAVVAVAKAIAPGFGGINLEDIAAPDCFEIEARLADELDIPVFHDDQHGTAIVTLAAMLNAARVVGKSLPEMRIVVLGVGAAGASCIELLLAAGAGDVLAVDRAGILHPGAEDLSGKKGWVAEHTNRQRATGTIADALIGADALVGVSVGGALDAAWLTRMAPDAIVFALANPVPEIMPENVPDNVRVMATGRSDYPNQINNVLVFPGMFRGLLDVRARSVDEPTQLAAARALAGLLGPEELSTEYIIPSVFDRRVAPAVAEAVIKAATASGAARVPAAD